MNRCNTDGVVNYECIPSLLSRFEHWSTQTVLPNLIRFVLGVNKTPFKFGCIVVADNARVLFIILTACSMPSGRAAVVNFIKEIYENCIHLFTGEAGSIENSEHYILIELPDVFAEIKIVYEGNLSASSNKRNTTAVTAVFWGLS